MGAFASTVPLRERSTTQQATASDTVQARDSVTFDAQARLPLLHGHESVFNLEQLPRAAESRQRETVRRVPHGCCFVWAARSSSRSSKEHHTELAMTSGVTLENQNTAILLVEKVSGLWLEFEYQSVAVENSSIDLDLSKTAP